MSSHAYKKLTLICRGLFLAGLLCCVAGCQTELAKWEFAQAQLQAESGEREAAIPRLRHAVAQSKDDHRLMLELARELAQLNDPESIELCDRVLDDPASNRSSGFRKYVLMIKCDCQQHSGDFPGALQSFKDLLRDHVQRNDEELNGLAYLRALAHQEIPQAAENIEQAIQMLQFQSGWIAGNSLTLAAKTAIANSELARYLDHQSSESPYSKSTLVSLSRQIENYETALQRLKEFSAYTDQIQQQPNFANDSSALDVVNLLHSNQQIMASNLATLLVVRALLYQDLDDQAGCNQDRFRAQELGADVELLVTQLPAYDRCLDLLQYSVMYLDTQGFIQSQLPWPEADGSLQRIQDFFGIQKPNLNSPQAILAQQSDSNSFAGSAADSEAKTQRLIDSMQDSPSSISSYEQSIENLTLAIEAIQVRRLAMASPLFNNANYSVSQIRRQQSEAKRTEAVLRYHRMLAHQRAGNSKAEDADRDSVIDLGFKPDESLF